MVSCGDTVIKCIKRGTIIIKHFKCVQSYVVEIIANVNNKLPL